LTLSNSVGYLFEHFRTTF